MTYKVTHIKTVFQHKLLSSFVNQIYYTHMFYVCFGVMTYKQTLGLMTSALITSAIKKYLPKC